MDRPVRSVASTIVEHALDLNGGEDVVVTAPPLAEPLVEELYRLLGEVGANPLWIARSDRVSGARLRALDPDAVTSEEHSVAVLEAADVSIAIQGSRNANEHEDVPGETLHAVQAVEPDRNELLADKQTVLTQYPGPGDAQRAGMSTAAYEAFVYGAIDRDWTEQKRRQQGLVDVLDSGDRLRIVSGDDTDVSMSIDGMDAVNDYGELNLPAGEVYTAPVLGSLEGHVAFDFPRLIEGNEISGVELTFDDGEIVEYTAETGERVLEGILHVDEGAKRIGEVGIGMNDDVDRITKNILFDEKMHGTVHLALGRAYEETVPDGKDRNRSGIHVDLLVDAHEESRVEVDGEPVLVDGEVVV